MQYASSACLTVVRNTWLDGRETHELDMHGVGVRFAVNSYGLDTELPRCSNDAACNLTSVRKELSGGFRWRVIGDVPVGYEDLVEKRLVVGPVLEVIDYSIHMSTHSAPDGTDKEPLTCGRETPGSSGKVRAGDHRLAVHSGGRQGNPCSGMSRKNLPPI